MATARNARTKGRAKPRAAVAEPKESGGKPAPLLRKLKQLVADSATRRNDLKQIHAAGQIIRELYAIEKESQEGASQYGKQWMHSLADRIHADWAENDRDLCGFLYRARQFASWPKAEVQRYAEVRKGVAKPLPWEYAWRMLSVREPANRAALVKRWRRHEFSLRAWDREIQQLHGIRLRGRPPVRPENVADALRQTEEMARRWIMWCTNNLRKPRHRDEGGAESPSPMLAAFPSPLKKLLEKMLPDMEKVRTMAEHKLRRMRKAEQ